MMKHQNKAAKLEIGSSETWTLYNRRKTGTSQLQTTTAEEHVKNSSSISYLIIGTSAKKRKNR
jgi:hypothetical protein